MKWLGDHPFHTLLVLTEKPGDWAIWKLIPVPVLVATSAGLLWARTTEVLAWGWTIAILLLGCAIADYVLLAVLPRRGLSYGPVQPPWLGLILVRGLVTVLVAPWLPRWPVAAFLSVAFLQVALWAIAVYGTVIEPFRLRVTHLEVTSPKLADDGILRLVQLSDLHVERLTRRERALPEMVASLEPDAILLSGDFLSTSYRSDQQALSDLRALLEQLAAPRGVFAVWGTEHVDIPSFLRPALTDLGITILEGQGAELNSEKQKVWLMGVNSHLDVDESKEELRRLFASAPPEAFVLLLHHTPDLMPTASALGVDLYLAGHTHGGQWRIPGFGAVLTSSRYWKRYESGAYLERSTQLYVNRGLGMEGFGTPRARFFCSPEIVSIRLTGTPGAR
jgi:predicted MPP superfamily phosphohydrolase